MPQNFDGLPYGTADDNTEILTETSGTLTRLTYSSLVNNLSTWQIVNFVMSLINSEQDLHAHSNNSAIHPIVDDANTSSHSVWTSARSQNAIDNASYLQLTTDDIAEGANNKYINENNIKQIINSTVNNVPIDYEQLASQMVTIMAQWENRIELPFIFTYEGDFTISIDSAPAEPCTGSFTVGTGMHRVILTCTSQTGKTSYFYNPQFAYQPWSNTLDTSGTTASAETSYIKYVQGDVVELYGRWVPELNLDVFADGTNNKLLNSNNLVNLNMPNSIWKHINNEYGQYHAHISDNTSDENSTWSSSYLIQWLQDMVDSKQMEDTTREIVVYSERANSGSNITNYNWAYGGTRPDDPTVHIHYVRRYFNYQLYRDNYTVNSTYFRLYGGTYFVRWTVDENVVNVPDVRYVNTFLADAYDHTDVVTTTSSHGVAIVKNYSTKNVTLWTRIDTTTPESGIPTNWLQPKNIPGEYEYYGTIILERIV